jgi:protein-S-isoprenylcysteine O-methyltransferase Ste14
MIASVYLFKRQRNPVVRAVLFLAGSIVMLPLSWRSLRHPRAHGFYRFFAFELLLALILLNAPFWLRDPFSVRQWVAWFLGAASIGLAIEGFRLLRLIGKPENKTCAAAQSANLPFENTTALVKVGAYRLIRHPLYASLLALAWSAYLKAPFAAGSVALTLGASGFLLATAIAEEGENLARFGRTYADYMATTRRFIPYLF